MKVIINKCFGGCRVTDAVAEYCNIDPWDFDRENPELIELIERWGDRCSGPASALCVVNVPDDATDYRIFDYDGAETLIYVQNGLMHTL